MNYDNDSAPNKRFKYDDYEKALLQCVEEDIDCSDDSYGYGETFIKSERESESDIEYEVEASIKQECDQEVKSEPAPSTSSNCETFSADPEYVWDLLFNHEIIERILRWTNARLVNQRSKYKKPVLSEFRELDIIELKSLIGVLLFTSIFKSNHEDLRSIFATDGSGRDIFRCTTSGNRFATILACLRFDDPTTRLERGATDPLAPISEIFNLFVRNCQEVYSIGTSARLDEIFISCRYHSMDSLKIFALTDERTGYFYNGHIHTGKGSEGYDLSEEEKRFAKPTQTVLKLARPIFGSHISIIADDRFSSMELVNLLKSKEVSYVGTSDKSSKDSGEFRKKKIPKFKNVDRYSDESELSGCCDLSTNCRIYSTSRRTKRWPMAVFFKILDICSVNSYILSQSFHGNSKLKRYEFIKHLGMQLITPELRRRFENVHLQREVRMCIGRILKIKEISSVDDAEEKLTTRKTCKRCPAQRNRKTAYFCIMCKIPVCLECTKKICKDCAI